MLLPPFVYCGSLYASLADALNTVSAEKRIAAARFEELCGRARIDIHKRVSDVKSVYYAADRYVHWGTINRFEFVEAKRSPMKIRKGEFIYVRYSRKDGQKLTDFRDPNQLQEFVGEPEADVEVSEKLLLEEAHGEERFRVEETTILDRRTQETIAIFTEVNDHLGSPLARKEGFLSAPI